MKPFILTIAICLAGFTGYAQGVNFEELTFAEAINKAAREKKMVFVDCYTSWCGPCKIMTNQVFPLQVAGEYFNPRFVCVKYDMEKGEGIALAKQFNVSVYPTFLVIDPASGTEVHRVVGGGDIEQFIAKIDAGLNEKTSLLGLAKEYAKGDMGIERLMAYRDALINSGGREQSMAVSNEIVSKLSLEEKVSRKFWPLYSNAYMLSREDFQFILDNRERFSRNIGAGEVDEVICNYFSMPIRGMITVRNSERIDPEMIERYRGRIGAIEFSGKQRLLDILDLAEVRRQKDVIATIAQVRKMMPTLAGNEVALYAGSISFTDRVLNEEEKKAVEGFKKDILSTIADPEIKAAHEKFFNDILSEEN